MESSALVIILDMSGSPGHWSQSRALVTVWGTRGRPDLHLLILRCHESMSVCYCFLAILFYQWTVFLLMLCGNQSAPLCMAHPFSEAHCPASLICLLLFSPPLPLAFFLPARVFFSGQSISFSKVGVSLSSNYKSIQNVFIKFNFIQKLAFLFSVVSRNLYYIIFVFYWSIQRLKQLKFLTFNFISGWQLHGNCFLNHHFYRPLRVLKGFSGLICTNTVFKQYLRFPLLEQLSSNI